MCDCSGCMSVLRVCTFAFDYENVRHVHIYTSKLPDLNFIAKVVNDNRRVDKYNNVPS